MNDITSNSHEGRDSAERLNQAVPVFNKWLVLKDAKPVKVVLGTVAANLLPGDPVWPRHRRATIERQN